MDGHHLDNTVYQLAAVEGDGLSLSVPMHVLDSVGKARGRPVAFALLKCVKVLPFFDCLIEVRQMEANNMTGALVLVD